MSNPRYPEEFKIQAVNQVTEKKHHEPPRVSRRLQPLRGWSDEKTTEVFPRGP